MIEFPYISRLYIDQKTKKEFNIFRPEIPIKIACNHHVFPNEFLALLDSGSDCNLFPWVYAISTGINPRKGKPKKITGIGQSQIIAFRNSMTIFVGGQKIETEVDFCEQQQIPLLGRDFFFNHFKEIIFKQSEHIVCLKK